MAISDAQFEDWLLSGAPGVLLFEANYNLPWHGIANGTDIFAYTTNLKASGLNLPAGDSVTLTWRGNVATLENKKTVIRLGSAAKALRLGWDINGNLWAEIDDGTTTVSGSLGSPTFATGVHTFAWVVDRNLDTITGYIDGAVTGTVLDISTVTGALDAATELHFGDEGSTIANTAADALAYDVVLNYAPLTAADVLAYYEDHDAIVGASLRGRWRVKIGYDWEAGGNADFHTHCIVVDSSKYRNEASAIQEGNGPPWTLRFAFEAADDGGNESIYLGTGPYISAAADTPASTPYAARVINTPEYKQSLDGFMGLSKTELGTIRLNNSDGALNKLIGADWTSDNTFELLYGDPGWARSDFRCKLKGVVVNVTATRDEVILNLRDTQQQLQNELIDDARLIGEAVIMQPFDLGSKVYKVADHAISDTVAAYDDGVPVTINSKDNANGKFTLLNTAVGVVTCNAKTGYYTHAEAIDLLLTTYTPLVAGDTSIASADLFDPTSHWVSVVVETNSEMLVSKAVDQLAKGGLGAVYTNRLGLVVCREFQHTADNVMDIDDGNMVDFRLLRVDYPRGKHIINNQPNWAPTASEVAKSVSKHDELIRKLPYVTTEFDDFYADQWSEAVDFEIEIWGQDSAAPALPAPRWWYAKMRDWFNAPIEYWEIDLAFPAVTLNIYDWVVLQAHPYWPQQRPAIIVAIADKADNTSTLTVLIR